MKKKAALYTSASLNGPWLLITISIALWLNKTDKYKEVIIYCVSNYNPLNFFSLFLRLKNLSSYLTENKFKKFKNFLKFSNYKNNKHSNLASFAIGKSNHAHLTIDKLEIKFLRIRCNKRNSLCRSIKLSYRALVDYLKYFKRSALRHKVFLKYRLGCIYAGLHVLSEALRSDYKSFGSVFQCRLGIFTALYKLQSCFEDYKEIVLSKESVSFVCGPAQEYIYGFFSRFMCDRGACFIDTSNKQQPFIKLQLKEKYYSRLKIFQIGDDVLTLDKKKISNYYKSRINRPWEKLNYMNFLKETHPSNNKVINFNGVSVILYLHSFTDAQYVYGYDGYTDLMDWAFRTIFILNSNKYVSKVIIKPHPGINPVHHPGDAIANKYLRSRFSSFEKVQWADFHFSVKHIKSSGLVVGITHHGSVAEELVFSKIPVIASTYSPWGEEYKFGYWWKNVKEYETLISNKLITELKVTTTQINELYRYAMDQYFSVNSKINFDIDSIWQNMLKIYGVKDCHEHSENMEQIKHLVSQLDPEDKKFKEFITTTVQLINSLKNDQSSFIIKN